MATTLSREEILDAIKNMTVLELSQLVKDMEETFGVTAAAPMMMGARRPQRLTTRWQGTLADEGVYFSTEPTARAANGAPNMAATCP